jgi:hypothetical protein
MCDYSLDLVASRPAKVGDELVTMKFQNSITRGFAAIGEPNVAVCLLPGTEVAFEKEVKYEGPFSLFPNMKLGEKVARFRQINVGKPSVHHDALEFPDGETVLLTRLCEGQHATVLQLPASPRPVNAAEGQKRLRISLLSFVGFVAVLFMWTSESWASCTSTCWNTNTRDARWCKLHALNERGEQNCLNNATTRYVQCISVCEAPRSKK